MFRFSRDRRFFSRVSFQEFTQTLAELAKMTLLARPTANVEILTAEDAHTYQYSHISFEVDEVTEALKGSKSYALEEFTQEVWKRALSIHLTIKDYTDPKPFMICLSLDRQDAPRSMKFYGQEVEQELADRICDIFSRPSFFWSIGDGYSKPSAFNLAFGQRLTGTRLT